MRRFVVAPIAMVLAAACAERAPPSGPILPEVELQVVGIRVGHDVEDGALVARTLAGGLGLRADGTASIRLDGDAVRLAGLRSAAAETSRSPSSLEEIGRWTLDDDGTGMRVDGGGLQRGAITLDRAVVAIVSIDPERPGEAGIVVGGRIAEGLDAGALVGDYHVRGFSMRLGPGAELVGATIRARARADGAGTLELFEVVAHEQGWATPFDAAGLTTLVSARGDAIARYTIASDGRLDVQELGSPPIAGRGFVARGGELAVLVRALGDERAIFVVMRAAGGLEAATVAASHSLVGLWLELEGLPYVAPVTGVGRIDVGPDAARLDFMIHKERWLDPPAGTVSSSQDLHLLPRPSHVIASDGTFAPAGEPRWHVLAADERASVFMIDFDVRDERRSESVRGLLIGLGD